MTHAATITQKLRKTNPNYKRFGLKRAKKNFDWIGQTVFCGLKRAAQQTVEKHNPRAAESGGFGGLREFDTLMARFKQNYPKEYGELLEHFNGNNDYPTPFEHARYALFHRGHKGFYSNEHKLRGEWHLCRSREHYEHNEYMKDASVVAVADKLMGYR
jgi:hypothetical protein